MEPELRREVLAVLTSAVCPLSGLESDVLERLTGRMTVRRYEAEDILIRQGEPGDTLFVLIDGRAEASVRPADGPSIALAALEPGSLVGEMSLLTKALRSASVMCATPVRAALLAASDFDALAVEYPDLLMVLTDVLAHRLGQSTFDGLSGKSIRDYRIERCIGRGGMGVVYEATRQFDGERVALKMMNHCLVYRPKAIRGFHQEADTLRSLSHRAIAKVFDRFAAYKTQFLVMELCEGLTLEEHLSVVGVLEERVVRQVVGQLAAALVYLFEQRLVHGDLKPSNVMLCDSGQVKLLDFGLSHALQSARAVPKLTHSSSFSGILGVAGTPRYMAPEQFGFGRTVDHRTDWYALAGIGYEALAGRPVTEADEIPAIYQEKCRFELPSVEELEFDLSPEMHEFLAQGLREHCEDRRVDLEALARWAAPVDR